MGVASRHFLIPRPNRFRPDAEQLCELIAVLAKGFWIHDPTDTSRACPAHDGCYNSHKFAEETGAYARTGRGMNDCSAVAMPIPPLWLKERMRKDLILAWPVNHMEGTRLRYPLRPRPEEPYYEFEIHLGIDYVYRMSELIDPFPGKVRCTCEQVLEYWTDDNDIFYSGRIRLVCTKCGKEFDPDGLKARVRNGWTGEVVGVISGGAASRFAIVVDCGKCIPPADGGRIDFEPDLVALCQSHLGCRFYQINDLY
jgi:hypothetical protein